MATRFGDCLIDEDLKTDIDPNVVGIYTETKTPR